MKSLIKIKSKIDYKIYEEFNNFYSRRISNSNSFIIYIIFLITLIIYFTFIKGKDTSNRTYIYILYIFSFIYVCFYIIIRSKSKKNIKKYYESAKKELETETTYKFYDDRIVSENEYNKTIKEYVDICNVYETFNAFYIFITTKTAFIIHKSFMNDEKVKELSEFLQSKIDPSKYLIYPEEERKGLMFDPR